jgi:hypothetical protein
MICVTLVFPERAVVKEGKDNEVEDNHGNNHYCDGKPHQLHPEIIYFHVKGILHYSGIFVNIQGCFFAEREFTPFCGHAVCLPALYIVKKVYILARKTTIRHEKGNIYYPGKGCFQPADRQVCLSNNSIVHHYFFEEDL